MWASGHCFVKEIVKPHRFPSSIVSDQDQVFLSQFWRQLFRLAGSRLKFSTAYHPKTNSQNEVVNHYLEIYLRIRCKLKPKK
ncbi:Tf2-6, partial [Mucuna pruriens]